MVKIKTVVIILKIITMLSLYYQEKHLMVVDYALD